MVSCHWFVDLVRARDGVSQGDGVESGFMVELVVAVLLQVVNSQCIASCQMALILALTLGLT